MKIAKDSVVSIDFKLHLGDGKLIDESEPGDPLVYLQGHEEVVPGLEKALEGKAKGDSLSVVIPPEDGYGPHDPEGLEEVPRDEFPEGLELQEGGILTATDPEGDEVDLLVKEIKGDTVVVDYNHPLAGKTLHFQLTVADVRAATAEELEHGHAHGPDSHH
ncbi:peptidylprolyl isomerase [Myxococcus sp. MISCRS1]|uniref:FKBP-type peptidyl-prolyl cis-trans isomerase n=1 Tax=Myxococcus TaxID=32 RepID=UPI00114189A9|nr:MULTISPECIES: peptidylprolyl isomerase [Myxococcus]BDT34616.1 peptidylprolyl isomerase [Myxococcus sp. MH1]MBZ4397379.1 peptidylprolyl isomerase [Myxococcus sp. AS-1-15]MBZ4410650.1 peptidylprolyl isomerase [Myxococcus sp. XM-1-1-1]MCK8498260.1 peptidylprolyl isomerase [Myxococcus fulvus]MCY1003795.1 peptidylprolyl isomerase [Myxococcus sp. MISCRS1]